MVIKRGDVYYVNLGEVMGSEQGGIRPIVILQNDVGNRYSPTIIGASLTAQFDKARLPVHVELSAEVLGLAKDSIVLLEQIRTLDKKRLKEKITHLTEEQMKPIDMALMISVGLA